MDYSVHPNGMVSFDYSSLANIHKSVKRNSRTSKRKIRMDINKNALQSSFESGRDFPNSASGPTFQGFETQSPVSGEASIQIQDLPTTPDYRVISAQSEIAAGASGMDIKFYIEFFYSVVRAKMQ